MHDYKLQPPQKTSSDTFSWLTSNSMRMIFTLCPPCDFIFHLCDFFESITSSQPFEWNAIDVTFHLNHISIVKKRGKNLIQVCLPLWIFLLCFWAHKKNRNFCSPQARRWHASTFVGNPVSDQLKYFWVCRISERRKKMTYW